MFKMIINASIENQYNSNLLKEQVSFDLEAKLNTYANRSAALSSFEKETGISRRHANRYLRKESTPQFRNLRIIYSFILNIYDYKTLINEVPNSVRDYLEKKNPSGSRLCSFDRDYSKDILDSPAFRTFYWKTADRGVLTEEFVLKEFGEYGLKVLKGMISRDIITEIVKGVYSSGPMRSFPINAEASKATSVSLIEDYFSPDSANEEGNNYLGFSVFKLNDKYKQIALEKILNLNSELARLSELEQGPVTKQLFSVLCLDTMDKTNKFKSRRDL